MKLFSTPARRNKYSWLILLLVCLGIVLFRALRPSTPMVIVLPLPAGFPSHKPSVVERLKAAVPVWVWRAKASMFGPPQGVLFDAAVFEFKGSPGSVLSGLSLGKPEFTDTNGLSVWIRGESDLSALRQHLKQSSGANQVASPRLMTAHGTRGHFSIGSAFSIRGIPTTADAELVVQLLPYLRRDYLDLTVMMTLKEVATNSPLGNSSPLPTTHVSIQTNFAIAARIRVPNGHGVFLLDAGRSATNGKPTGLLISATLPTRRK